MNEETSQKTVALIIRGTHLTEEALRKAMLKYLSYREQTARSRPETHGKLSVRKLLQKDMGAQTIEINDKNIKGFERIAKKYNVDFAVKLNKNEKPPKYTVFFKARDAEVVAMAFKDFCNKNEKKKSRVSVREKLKKFAVKISLQKDNERIREKNKNKGRDR